MHPLEKSTLLPQLPALKAEHRNRTNPMTHMPRQRRIRFALQQQFIGLSLVYVVVNSQMKDAYEKVILWTDGSLSQTP